MFDLTESAIAENFITNQQICKNVKMYVIDELSVHNHKE